VAGGRCCSPSREGSKERESLLVVGECFFKENSDTSVEDSS
jgi:hypothetical protein